MIYNDKMKKQKQSIRIINFKKLLFDYIKFNPNIKNDILSHKIHNFYNFLILKHLLINMKKLINFILLL